MNKENIETLKKLREDLYNYSIEYNKIDYLKARYALEEELEFANTLQSNWNSLREFFENGLQSSKTFKESDAIYEDSLMINKVLEVALDKMNELEGKDK